MYFIFLRSFNLTVLFDSKWEHLISINRYMREPIITGQYKSIRAMLHVVPWNG